MSINQSQDNRLFLGVGLFFVMMVSQTSLNISFLNDYLPEWGGGGDGLPLLAKPALRSSLWAIFFGGISYSIRGRIARYLTTAIFGLIYAIAFCSESVLHQQFGSLYTHSHAVTLLSSNPEEASGFVDSLLQWSKLSPALGTLLLCVILWIGLWTFIKFCHNRFALPRIPRWAIYLGLLLWGAFHFGVSLPNIYAQAKEGKIKITSLSSLDRYIWCTYSALNESKRIEQFLSELKNSTQGDISKVTPLPAHNIVLVLGETLRRDYMHLYGYSLPNTPFLDSLVASGKAVAMTDVDSPAAGTVTALQHVLTLKQTTDSKPWYMHPAFPLLMQEAGYKTAWYSNQEFSGFFMQILTSIAQLCQTQQFTPRPSLDDEALFSNIQIYDEDILNMYEPSARNPQDKHFDILHLMGSHITYQDRYPKAFERFTSQDLPTPLGGEKDIIRTHYVNSILYNDHILKRIVKHYQDTPTLIIYISDHGEILFDHPDRPDFFGHGELVPQTYQIPMIVYPNDKMRELMPELLPKIQVAKDRPFMTDWLIPSLMGLMGIESDKWTNSQNVFSPDYQMDRPREKFIWDNTMTILDSNE